MKLYILCLKQAEPTKPKLLTVYGVADPGRGNPVGFPTLTDHWQRDDIAQWRSHNIRQNTASENCSNITLFNIVSVQQQR